MSSSSSSSSAAFAFAPPPDHHHHLSSSPPTEQLCYVQCDFCHTVLAVCVPCTSLFKTVTVRCGHCTNLLSVNMRALLLPSPNHHLFGPQNLQEEIKNSPSSLVMQQQQQQNSNDSFLPIREMDVELPKVQAAAKRPPEKRQRVPSAYNRFIKDEIQRIKAGNPDISHREAFSAAAKNWAHFPHIHFGLMATDQPLKKPNVLQQYHQEVAAVAEGDEVHQHHVNVHVMKDGAAGFLGPPNVGLSPY